MKTRFLIIIGIFIISSLIVILPNYWLEFDDFGVFVCDMWFDSHYTCNRIWLDPDCNRPGSGCIFPEKTPFEQFLEKKAKMVFNLKLDDYRITSEVQEVYQSHSLGFHKSFLTITCGENSTQYYLATIFDPDESLDNIDVEIYEIISDKCNHELVHKGNECELKHLEKIEKPIYSSLDEGLVELTSELDCDEICSSPEIKETNIPVHPRFTNGVTEIINPEHNPLKYRSTHPIIDDTYLSKNVEHWNGAWRSELDIQYGIYGDDFYTEVGRLLIKNEMQYQMNNLGIVNTNDDFEVFSGGMLTSLPPHIGFSAVVYATDGNYYRLEGGTFGNQVSYYKTTQLQFPDTVEELPMASILSKSQLITIVPEDGNKARQEPGTLVIHVDDNTVEFFNNTPEIIRIQDSGSGRVGEESTLSWMGPTVLPYQNATVTFDEPGLIEWDARNAPNLEDPLWWSTHAGGYIVVLSEDVNNFSREDKARIAQKMLHGSDIPITSSGSGNAEKVLKIGLDPAVSEIIPNAEEYYLQRAHQIIPFDVEIVMYE